MTIHDADGLLSAGMAELLDEDGTGRRLLRIRVRDTTPSVVVAADGSFWFDNDWQGLQPMRLSEIADWEWYDEDQLALLVTLVDTGNEEGDTDD